MQAPGGPDEASLHIRAGVEDLGDFSRCFEEFADVRADKQVSRCDGLRQVAAQARGPSWSTRSFRAWGRREWLRGFWRRSGRLGARQTAAMRSNSSRGPATRPKLKGTQPVSTRYCAAHSYCRQRQSWSRVAATIGSIRDHPFVPNARWFAHANAGLPAVTTTDRW